MWAWGVGGWESASFYLDALDHHILERSIARPCRGAPDLAHDVHATLDLAEDRVLVIEMRCRPERDEELTAVGVRPRVRHRQDARLAVAQA